MKRPHYTYEIPSVSYMKRLSILTIIFFNGFLFPFLCEFFSYCLFFSSFSVPDQIIIFLCYCYKQPVCLIIKPFNIPICFQPSDCFAYCPLCFWYYIDRDGGISFISSDFAGTGFSKSNEWGLLSRFRCHIPGCLALCGNVFSRYSPVKRKHHTGNGWGKAV